MGERKRDMKERRRKERLCRTGRKIMMGGERGRVKGGRELSETTVEDRKIQRRSEGKRDLGDLKKREMKGIEEGEIYG